MKKFPRKIVRWFRSLFAWRTVHDTGIWIYQENGITGERRALRHVGCAKGYQPIDHRWLDGAARGFWP